MYNLHLYFLALFVLLMGACSVHSEHEFEIINEIINRRNSSLNKTVYNDDRKKAKQGGDDSDEVAEAVSGNYLTGLTNQIRSVLNTINSTYNNFLLESSKRIPEDLRVSLKNAIKNLPEPFSSLLRGPLEQINEFLQLGVPPSSTTGPSYIETASTFPPDHYTVAPPRSTSTDSSSTDQAVAEEQLSFIPATNSTSNDNNNNLPKTTPPPFLYRIRKTTTAVPVSNSDSEAENDPEENSVAKLFANISTQFQPDTQFTNPDAELKNPFNASESSQENYKAAIDSPDKHISSGIYSNSSNNENGKPFSNTQGYLNNSNEQQLSNNQGYLGSSDGQQFSNGSQAFQNSSGEGIRPGVVAITENKNSSTLGSATPKTQVTTVQSDSSAKKPVATNNRRPAVSVAATETIPSAATEDEDDDEEDEDSVYRV